MELHINTFLGDITHLPESLAIDCIVNAANVGLLQGGGVCGAIFSAAGVDKMSAACGLIAPCSVGESRITPGFDLQRIGVEWVIHTVGPRYSDYSQAEASQLLASAYQSTLLLAASHGVRHIGIPPISTGIFGFPPVQAARIAIDTIRNAVQAPSIVTLVSNSVDGFAILNEALAH